jgi:hypothetical protein
MRQFLRWRLRLLIGLGLLSTLGVGVWDWGWAEQPARLRSGMTTEEVHKLIGPPKRTARQILSHRYREQWIYDPPLPARLQFDCRRGQQPQLLDTK